ncbi:glycosyltransferase family 39 protein [Humibacter antri]
MVDTATAPVVSAVRTSERRRLGGIAVAAGLVALAVSLIGSWIPSLWGDEAASLLSAQRSFGSLFTMLGHVDAVHGLYYVLLHFWVNVAGTSPFAIRLPSAVGVGLGAAAVVWMCGRMRGLRFAVIAGIVAVVLPRLTYAGEEARSYATDAALCAVVCAIVVEIVLRRHRSVGLWTAYGLVLVFATYLFLYNLLIVIAIGVFLALTPMAHRHLRGFVTATGLAVIASAPLLVFAYLERAQVAYLADQAQVTSSSVFVQMWFGAVPFAIVAWLLILVAVGDLVLRTVKSRREARAIAVRTPIANRPELVVLALCWLVLPMGVLIATSALMHGFTARYGTIAAPAAAILIAAGIDRLASLTARRWVGVVGVAAVLVAAAPVWVSQREPYSMNESDWNQIAATVHANAQQGDGIVFDEGVRPSRRTRLAMSTNPAAFSAVKDVTLRVPYTQSHTWYGSAYTVEKAAAMGRFHGIDRVWVVEYSMPGHVYLWGTQSLEQLGYHKTAQYSLHRSVIYLFTR